MTMTNGINVGCIAGEGKTTPESSRTLPAETRADNDEWPISNGEGNVGEFNGLNNEGRSCPESRTNNCG